MTISPEQGSDSPRLNLRRASSVAMKPLKFLVPGVLPRGKLVLLAGRGGLGKSTITADIAARLSRGERAMGLEYDPPPPCEVIFATCEDDPEDTLVPRLAAAGADLDKIHFPAGVCIPSKPGERPTPWSLAHHVALENTLKANPGIRLLIIDPATAFAGLAGVDGHKDAELRALLGPLSDAAAAHDLTIVLVVHLSKRQDVGVVEKVMGSVAWVNSVRMAWVVMPAPSPHKEKLFLPIKSNLTKDACGFGYRIVGLDGSEKELALAGVNLGADDKEVLGSQLYRVAWLGRSDADPDEVESSAMQQRRGNPKADPNAAAAWLADRLAAGPVRVAECVGEGNAALKIGKSEKWWRDTVLVGKLGGRSLKEKKFSGKWYFALPGSTLPPPSQYEEDEESSPEEIETDSLDSLQKTAGFYEESITHKDSSMRSQNVSSDLCYEESTLKMDSSQKQQDFTKNPEESSLLPSGLDSSSNSMPSERVPPSKADDLVADLPLLDGTGDIPHLDEYGSWDPGSNPWS
jgi:hypothetical protein